MQSIDYDPSTLREIDTVEIIGLLEVDAPNVSAYMTAAVGLSGTRVDGEVAQEIAALFRTLPRGPMMRCHVPPYGVRFYARGAVALELSLCWKCNNAFGRAGAAPIDFVFDGEAAASRALFARISALHPLAPRDEG